jgi:hypothetical protein
MTSAPLTSSAAVPQVLLPALQKLVELPEWHKWLTSLQLVYPHPPEQATEFVEQSQ